MPARCTFIFNPVLVSMVINDDNIEIKFKKYTKRYFGIDKLIWLVMPVNIND